MTCSIFYYSPVKATSLALGHLVNDGSRWRYNSIWKLGLATDVIGLPKLTLLLMTKNVSSTSTMPPLVPKSRSMITYLINFTESTKESGNSSAKAMLTTHLFPFFWFFHQFLQLFEGWQHWIPRLPSGKHGKHGSPLVKHWSPSA